MRFRISNFEFRICRPPACIPRLEPTVGVALLRRASYQGPRDLTPTDARVCSPRVALPAPSSHLNQPRMPFNTPTSRKGAAGPARRGFPRAGGRGVGAGKNEFEGVPPLECSPPARRRRARALTGATEKRVRSEGVQVSDRGRGRRPWPAGVSGTGSGTGSTRMRQKKLGARRPPSDCFGAAGFRRKGAHRFGPWSGSARRWQYSTQAPSAGDRRSPE